MDTPGAAGASSEQVRRLREHLDDAVDLGAEGPEYRGPDQVEGWSIWRAADASLGSCCPIARPATLERVRSAPLAERILERLPALEITIVADSKSSTDAYRVGRGD